MKLLCDRKSIKKLIKYVCGNKAKMTQSHRNELRILVAKTILNMVFLNHKPLVSIAPQKIKQSAFVLFSQLCTIEEYIYFFFKNVPEIISRLRISSCACLPPI